MRSCSQECFLSWLLDDTIPTKMDAGPMFLIDFDSLICSGELRLDFIHKKFEICSNIFL